MYRGRERDINFKELVYMIVEAGKSKICRAGHQAGDLKELQFECEGNLLAEFSENLMGLWRHLYSIPFSKWISTYMCTVLFWE